MNISGTYILAFFISFSIHLSLIWTLPYDASTLEQKTQTEQLILLNLVNNSNVVSPERYEKEATQPMINNNSEPLPESETPHIQESKTDPKSISDQGIETVSAQDTGTTTHVLSSKASENTKKVENKVFLESQTALESPPELLEPASSDIAKPEMSLTHLTKSHPNPSEQKDLENDSPNELEADDDDFISARFIDLKRPPYPLQEKMKGHSGSVLFEIHISSSGEIHEVKMLQSSGYALLDKISRRAIWQAQLVPASQSGVPVASIKSLRFTYTLD